MKKARTVTEAKKELGRRVASARQDAGLTQVQLSDAIEKRFKKEDIRLSVRSIEEIEAGRANPSLKNST